MARRRTSLKSQREKPSAFRLKANIAGQATLEAVLIIAVLVSVAGLIGKTARDRGFMRSLVEGPWSHVRGMIESGAWVRAADGPTVHPNDYSRFQSTEGTKIN